jgi:hypothetical protein
LTALAAALLCAGVATLVATAPARAAVIDGAITSISTTSSHTAQWDQVTFQCSWAVPSGSQSGDTFSLQLPPELKWFGSTTFSLDSPDGQPVATAHADPSGAVVFTLTSYAAAHPQALHGTCQFTTLYSVVGTGGEVTLTFQVGSQVIRVPIETQGPCTQDCGPDRSSASKTMWWSDDAQTTTQSVVRGPATTADTSTVTLVDHPKPGLALDCATVTTRIGAHLDQLGDIADPRDDTVYPPTVSCTPTQATARWTDLPAGEFTELRVGSTVVDPSLSTYENTGTVTINGVDAPVSDQVRRTTAGGTGEGTPNPTTTSTTSTTSTTTSAPPTTSSTTSTTSSTTSTTTTTPAPTTTTTTTTPSTTAIATPTSTTAPPTPQTAGSLPFAVSATTTTGSTVAPATAQGLAFTGADVRDLLVLAVALLATGLGVLLLARRSQQSQI